MAETVKVLVPEEDVAKRIKELGEQISTSFPSSVSSKSLAILTTPLDFVPSP